MNVWLNIAESRIKAQGAIGPGYDDVKRQQVQANSQIIMIVWAKIQQNNVSFHLTGTATFRASAVPRLRFKGSLETETSSR